MEMTELLTASTKSSFLLGFLCFNVIFAIDFVEVMTNDIDMNTNDGELIFASVVSAEMEFI